MQKLFVVIALALVMFTAPAAGQNQGNFQGIVFPSAARTAAQYNSAAIQNIGWRGVHVIINVTAYTSGNYTPKIQAQDIASGVWYDILVGTAISSTGTTVIKAYPGTAAIANGAAIDFLPKIWRVQMNGLSTPSMTFSVGYNADM